MTAKEYIYEEIAVGQEAAFTVEITDELIADFARLSGDYNPLHTDPDYAAQTSFKRPVAHGMIAGALFSRLVGMELPGAKSLYLSQTLKFHKPFFARDVVDVTGVVEKKTDAFRTITLHLSLVREPSGELLVDGEALVRVLE